MQYYLEYEIIHDRPGLLGDVATLIGMLRVNIVTVSSIKPNRRGFLLSYNTDQQLESLRSALLQVQDLDIKIFHEPQELDLLTLKHGKRIRKVASDPPVYRFVREELDYVIDFLGGHLVKKPNMLIGLRGSPRIGKSETAIAASVHANKTWVLISSTLFKQVIRTSVDEETLNEQPVLIIDALTTFARSFPEHIQFVKRLLDLKVPKIIEHPEVLVRETDLKMSDFDLIVELFSSEDDEEDGAIEYVKSSAFNRFDIS